LKIIVMLGVVVVAMAGGIIAALGLLQRGDRTDVGDLAALASVQAQLRSVDACRIEHNMPAKSYYREMYRRIVFLTPCGASGFVPSRAKVNLPSQWTHDALSFEAVRSSATDDWSILVDQKAVPFPVLVAGLGELAPIVVREAPGALAKLRAEEAEGKAKYEESERRREQAREQNQDSYPTR
jgi:hypothetical protein